jgi:hypothetical protein
LYIGSDRFVLPPVIGHADPELEQLGFPAQPLEYSSKCAKLVLPRSLFTAANISMSTATHTLQVATRGKGLYEITDAVAKWLKECHIVRGLLTVFVQHTSASLIVRKRQSNPSFAELRPVMQ